MTVLLACVAAWAVSYVYSAGVAHADSPRLDTCRVVRGGVLIWHTQGMVGGETRWKWLVDAAPGDSQLPLPARQRVFGFGYSREVYRGFGMFPDAVEQWIRIPMWAPTVLATVVVACVWWWTRRRTVGTGFPVEARESCGKEM